MAKELSKGFNRVQVKCTECGKIACYDYMARYGYVPFSSLNPIVTLPCGHSAGNPWSNDMRHITFDEYEK